MEEIKNEQPEEVVEQRPSTKYGRTAYQEELRREQANQPQIEVQPVWQEQFTSYEAPTVVIKNTRVYAIMVLVGITFIINCIVSMMTMDVFSQLATLDVMDVMESLSRSPGYIILAYVGDAIFWITAVLIIWDIITLRKAGKKILGAILFGILLRPAYGIWRAHLLGQKKWPAVAYTVIYYGLCIVEYVFIFMKTWDLVTMLGY